MDNSSRDFLLELLRTPSPSGWEMEGQKLWAGYLQESADSVEFDAYGNAWARLEGSAEATQTLMLASHADEIGFIVRQITSEGFLRVDRIGGSDVAVARGRKLRLLTAEGEVRGIVGNTAIHLRRGNLDKESVAQVSDLYVDVGAGSREEAEAMGLRVGIPAVYADEPEFIGEKLLCGRALDNRIGSFLLAEVLRQIAATGQRPAFHLVVLNAVQEELGGYGATMATHRLQPDAAICFDVAHATDTPGINLAQHGEIKFGAGPTVTHGAANHRLLVERLVQIASFADIPLQHEAASRSTGTDTDSIFISRSGVPSALVSLPLRYMHSVVETAHLDDLRHTIGLLSSFIEALSADDVFSFADSPIG